MCDFIANTYCSLPHVKLEIRTIFLIMNWVNGSHPTYFTDKEEVVVVHRYFICQEIGGNDPDSPACFLVKLRQKEHLVQVVYGN